MPDSDPPIDPNSTGLLIRTDAGARKLIDRLDRQLGPPPEPGEPTLRDEMVALKASTVKWDRLTAILGAAATVIVSASWRVMSSNMERSDKINAAQIHALREEVLEIRKQSAYAYGSYQVMVEKKAPAIVAREVREVTGGHPPLAPALDGGVR